MRCGGLALDTVCFATPTEDRYTPTVSVSFAPDSGAILADNQARSLHAGQNRGPMLSVGYWCEAGCRGRIELREHKGLGRRIGESSGTTSYHLRVMADLGFVEDDPDHGDGRDRWWLTPYRRSAFSVRSPDDPGDAETIGLDTQFIRLTVESNHHRIRSFVDSLPDRAEELPTLPWTFSEIAIELTHEQARVLPAEVTAVVQRYRREPGTPPKGDDAERAVFSFQIFPDEDAS